MVVPYLLVNYVPFSSMGNVDLLPKEKETVLQNLPQVSCGTRPFTCVVQVHLTVLRLL